MTAVAATAVVLLAAGACTYESADDDAVEGSGGDATFQAVEPDPRRARADGDDGPAVCAAATATDDALVLADETFDLEGIRWVFCAGGTDGEVVAARSLGPGEWELRDVPVPDDGDGPEASDTVVVSVADAYRAWVTHDGLDPERHVHTWTEDGGTTWARIFAGP